MGTHFERFALIIVGPTCSGKSFLALRLAERLKSVIINADAMQCYRDLRILTARPTEEEERQVPHTLYGVLPWFQMGNAGWWREQALAQLEQAWDQRRLPIVCGGTGMYLNALIHGIAEIPEPSQESRNQARQMLSEKGCLYVYDQLKQFDPLTALKLKPTDAQRIARAWEVWKSTGQGLHYWQQKKHLPGAQCKFLVIRLAPPRSSLKEAVKERFENMIENGAVKEVEQLLQSNPHVDAPLLHTHGVAELGRYLKGELSLSQATAQSVLRTQRYIKRQETWFNNQKLVCDDQNCIFSSIIDQKLEFYKSIVDKSLHFIKSFIDPLRLID